MTSSSQKTDIISTGEVARMLGISRQAVFDRVQRGTLIPIAKTRSGYLFDPADAERLRVERASVKAK